MPTQREFSIRITAELRWAAAAHTLIGRDDRVESLRQRCSQLSSRLCAAEEAYRALLGMDGVDAGILESSRKDLEQLEELCDGLLEADRRLAREAKLNALDSSPLRRATQPELLGRLPTIELPRFSGCLSSWLGFEAMFNGLVDSRQDLAPTQKMAYLLSALDGEALQVVAHLDLAPTNYTTARLLLQRRYANVRRLADGYVGQILSLPMIRGVEQLRFGLVNPVVVATNGLRKLDLPVEEWSFLLLHIVLSRLPSDLKLRFEQRHGGDGASYLPGFQELISFLEQECRLAENAGVPAPVSPSGRSAQEGRRGGAPQGGPSKEGRVAPRGSPPSPRFRVATASAARCTFCKGPGHRVGACPDFAALSVRARRSIANARKWCYSCLEPHWQRDCASRRPCPHCQGNHLGLLCANRNGEAPERERELPTARREEESPPRRAGGRSHLTGGLSSPPPLF
ncbi:uncharacterized protein LOC128199306 [Bicyclus anynana]|uniref:Uncharacterized protein LOC128199306 n=1 Tax=Bicyclus anynana TaxID=110368 RepID=A0ABM3LYU6_BICAN|nr:uncharacterized protein LOC128199306 [Bicyclus anynana]